jgi:pSer/pThr/pTyr-binding forkhead associated (FHA) protein
MNARILMADKDPRTTGISADWLVQGVLTKVGDMFDRFTGRGWKPSSSLATSELIEKLKALLDSEARDEPPGCKFVPNNIKLKMQWDKFSTDSDDSLRKLETELLAAAVDHINDKRYFTHAPLSIEVKPDYFTPGVRLLVSFDKFADEDREAGVQLSAPETQEQIDDSVALHKAERTFIAAFAVRSGEKRRSIELKKGVRLGVGRTRENDLSIDDASVSKLHASLTVNDNGDLIVADTGSTNGTFVNDERIPYGKAIIVGDGGRVRFGSVDVVFTPEHIPMPGEKLASNDPGVAAQQSINDAGEKEEVEDSALKSNEPAPTEPAFLIDMENSKEGQST